MAGYLLKLPFLIGFKAGRLEKPPQIGLDLIH
jgi:hypothetical protein